MVLINKGVKDTKDTSKFYFQINLRRLILLIAWKLRGNQKVEEKKKDLGKNSDLLLVAG
jgi:hypothetical protein